MKVLVINASANKERSTTLKLTKTLLEGLGVEASEVEYVTTIGLPTPYLEKVKQAGAEYKETERISDDTQTYLDTPMLPAEIFVKTVNGIFEGMLNV